MKTNKEALLYKNGYQQIAGLDEVGRGAWAGPMVAGAVIVFNNKGKYPSFITEINDSKRINPAKRKILFDLIKKNFIWSIGIVPAWEIDQLGISEANKLVLQRAVLNLKIKPDYLLIDYIKNIGLNIACEGVKYGDSKIFSIAAASIIAKVYRDQLMVDYHKRYNKWYFNQHKGYGTSLHQQRLNKFGICKLHRQSFYPVKQVL